MPCNDRHIDELRSVRSEHVGRSDHVRWIRCGQIGQDRVLSQYRRNFGDNLTQSVAGHGQQNDVGRPRSAGDVVIQLYADLLRRGGRA